MNARADRFPLIDSLRALAAFAVLATHAAFFSGVYDNETLRPYAARLDVGVTLFFLISGFLLYRPFVRARLRDEPPPHTGAYGWRRLLRIAPAYWVALTVVGVWIGAKNLFSSDAFLYYGFLQIYQPRTALGGIAQAWTLCIEVTFYAMLPLWAAALRRRRHREPVARLRGELQALAGLVVFSLAYKAWALATVDPNGVVAQPWLLPLPNFLDHFALGMALAVASVWYEGRDRLPRPLRLVSDHPALCWLMAAVAFWAVSTQIGLTGAFGEHLSPAPLMARHVLYAVVALGLILPAVFGDPRRGLIRRVLANRALLFLGLVSYSIYLYHMAFLTQLHRWDFGGFAGSLGFQPWVIWFLAGAAGATVIATVSYLAVERPALRLKRWVGPRPGPATRGEALAEPAPVAPAAPRAG